MRVIVFINSHSRQAKRHVDDVKRYFSRRHAGLQLVDFIVIDDMAKFKPAIAALKKRKDFDCLVIGSGDGTIVALLNALKGRSKLSYGLLPLGTSNTFARSLGLPLDLKQALKIVAAGESTPVSLGSINGTLFANIADIGVPVEVADNVTDRIKKYLGSMAYAVSGIRELARHKAIWCELKIGKETTTFHSHQVFVANGKNRGPIQVPGGASAYKNSLLLGYSASKSRFEYLKDAYSIIVGKSKKRPKLVYIPIASATLVTKPIQRIQADGEIIGKTPAKIKVVKDAIRVLVDPSQSRRSGKTRKNRH